MKILDYIIDLILKIIVQLGYEPTKARQEKYDDIEDEDDEFEPSEVTAPDFYSPVGGDTIHITSPWGYRKMDGLFHYGIDIRNPHDAPVYAPENAVVIAVKEIKKSAPVRFAWKNGAWVDLQNGAITPYIFLRGLSTGNVYRYFHARPIVGQRKVRVGEKIEAGEPCGISGNYGYSQGPHLHFETIIDGQHKNPINWIKKNLDVSITGRVS